MSCQQEDLIKSIVALKHSSKFKQLLAKLDGEDINFIIECFLNFQSFADTRREQDFFRKHRKLFKASSKISTLKAAKKFLILNFKFAKKVLAFILSSYICKEVAGILSWQKSGE